MSCKGWSSSSSPELSPVFKTYTWTLSVHFHFQISKHTVLRCASPLTFLDVEKCFQCRKNIGLCGTCLELCSEGCEKNSTPSTIPLARLDKDRGKNDWVSRCPADKCVSQRLSIHDQLPWSKPAPRQCSHSSGTKRPHTSTTKNVWEIERQTEREGGEKN